MQEAIQVSPTITRWECSQPYVLHRGKLVEDSACVIYRSVHSYWPTAQSCVLVDYFVRTRFEETLDSPPREILQDKVLPALRSDDLTQLQQYLLIGQLPQV